MYTLANCTASILRRLEGKDEYGDPTGQYLPVTTGVQAMIQESTTTAFDYSTQTPRIVRTMTGTFPSVTDIRVLDRVVDEIHQVTYVVENVTLQRAPGHQPDLQATLRKVTS